MYENRYLLSKWILTDDNGQEYDVQSLFETYLRYGGFLSLSDFDQNEERIQTELNDLYQTIILRDVVYSRLINPKRAITDPALLDKVLNHLLETAGNSISYNKVTNALINLDSVKESKPNNKTITSYVKALIEAFILYEVGRFDVKGKKILTTVNKYYLVDTGKRNRLLSYQESEKILYSGHRFA